MKGSLVTTTFMWVIIAIAIAAGVWIFAFSGLTGTVEAASQDQADVVSRTIASVTNSMGPVHSGEIDVKSFIVGGAWDVDVVKTEHGCYVRVSQNKIVSEVPVMVELKETDTIYDARGIKVIKSPDGVIELVKRA